jgi:hypothetical protein
MKNLTEAEKNWKNMLFAIHQGKESDSRLDTFGRMSLETNLVVVFIGLIAKIEGVSVAIS